jgi:primosomal protein DnaI
MKKTKNNEIIITYQEEIKNKIKNSLELKNWIYGKDYHEEDLITIGNYLKDEKETPFGYQLILKTKPSIHMVYKETDQMIFYNFKNKLQKIHSLFNQSLDLENLKQINIENFEGKIVKKYWNNFESEQKKPSLYIYGDFDTGKTFFFKLMMKYFLKEKQDFLFLFLPDLPRQFKSGWFDEELSHKMDYLRNIPYLFLDDLGAENLTVYFRDDILYPLLNARQEKGLITFISSNLSIEQLIEHLQITNDNNQIMKAFRIINKLKKMCQLYNFDLTHDNLNQSQKRFFIKN